MLLHPASKALDLLKHILTKWDICSKDAY